MDRRKAKQIAKQIALGIADSGSLPQHLGLSEIDGVIDSDPRCMGVAQFGDVRVRAYHADPTVAGELAMIVATREYERRQIGNV